MKKFVIHIGALMLGFILGTLLFNGFTFLRSSICTHHDDLPPITAITALKERCRATFSSTEFVDDYLNILETEDEAGNVQFFAVYYRQYKDLDTNVFLLVPDKETEQSWFSYLKKMRSKTAKEGELDLFSFTLQEDGIWISSSCREA